MNKKIIKYVVAYLAITLIAFLAYYITLPAINLQNEGFWVFLAFLIFIYTLPFSFNLTLNSNGVKIKKNSLPFNGRVKFKKLSFIALAPIAILIIGLIISSTLFNARAYASVITVEESVFEVDMPKTTNVTNIALMDTASAQKLGDKKLGSLEEFVSQYTVSEQYNQINFNNSPKKVAVLEYEDFFKWIGNKNKGVPGYIMVDPAVSNQTVNLRIVLLGIDSCRHRSHAMTKKIQRHIRILVMSPRGYKPHVVDQSPETA